MKFYLKLYDQFEPLYCMFKLLVFFSHFAKAGYIWTSNLKVIILSFLLYSITIWLLFKESKTFSLSWCFLNRIFNPDNLNNSWHSLSHQWQNIRGPKDTKNIKPEFAKSIMRKLKQTHLCFFIPWYLTHSKWTKGLSETTPLSLQGRGKTLV